MTCSAIRFNRVEPSEISQASPSFDDSALLDEVSRIVQRVRTEKEVALREFVQKFDGRTPEDALLISGKELDAARGLISSEERGLLERTTSRIQSFAEAQYSTLTSLSVAVPGGRAGHDYAPMERVGCYAPGGVYPLPSSVLMTVVPARVAGVSEVVVATPKPTPILLAAAAIAGADEVICAGGAQAIAALAFGVGVRAVDYLCGPGNRWVTAAKRLVFGTVGVDMLAGPSELVIVADKSSSPDLVAADLLAQAEHDVYARVAVLCFDEGLIKKIEDALNRQIAAIRTRDVATASLERAMAVLVSSVEQAAQVCNRIAPEHLSLHLANPDALKSKLRHYGALFVGEKAAEAFGDYGVGPNHVLPTAASARYTGGLSVASFMRMRTWLELDSPQDVAEDCAKFARIEGLEAHARSIDARG